MWPFPRSRTARLRRRLSLADSFRRRLEVDRLRADRMGISIALITIRWDPRGSWDGRPDEDCVRAEVADLVDEHLRATDEAGGLGDDEIGVVLWNTGREGAERFINRLMETAPKRLRVEPTAYLYPMVDSETVMAEGSLHEQTVVDPNADPVRLQPVTDDATGQTSDDHPHDAAALSDTDSEIAAADETGLDDEGLAETRVAGKAASDEKARDRSPDDSDDFPGPDDFSDSDDFSNSDDFPGGEAEPRTPSLEPTPAGASGVAESVACAVASPVTLAEAAAIRPATTAPLLTRPVFEPLAPALARTLSPLRRAIDIVGSSVGLLAAAPVLAVAAAAIKWEDRGPVFFTQHRSGLGGRPFAIWKLRTMALDAEARKAELQAASEQDGAAFKMTHDPRITRIGRLLRKTSVDELPQLWNVFRGEMSLVGPRPLPVDEANSCDVWQRRRLDVMPGLTCIWQVEGRSRVSFVEWMRMDMRYIARRGLWQDLRLMIATVPAVLAQRGAK